MTSNFTMPNAQIWSFLAENCPKPIEILRIPKNDVSIVFFVPKM